MDKIPPELIDRISSYLEHDDLKSTLLLSKSFHFSAERYSRAFYRFALHEGNANKFVNTFSGHRLSYLRELEFWIRLPRIEYRYPEGRDNADQLRENDRSLTQQITFLFDTIKTVEQRAGEQNNPGKILLKLYAPLRWVSNKYPTLAYHRQLSWRVYLLEAERLPTLGSIRALEIRRGVQAPFEARDADYRLATVKLDYRVMVDLAVKFPNLEYLGCRIGGDEWQPKWETKAARYLTRDWAGPRRDTRRDFAEALKSARLPNSLRRICLDFLHRLDEVTGVDHLNAQPNLVMPAPNDPFSISLHHLSHQLRRIHLRVVADKSLFWSETGGITSWPNLESLVVMFHMVSPSGKWYFQGPNGEGRNMVGFEVTDASYPPLEESEYDEEMQQNIDGHGHRKNDTISSQFRIVPNNDTLRPFLVGFASATAHMRLLKEAALWCSLAWEPEYGSDHDSDDDDHAENEWLSEITRDYGSLAWGIYYLASGERDFTHPERLPSEVPQLWWRVSKWRPDPELHELFQQIGRQLWGGSLKEHWIDDTYGEGLVNWHYFESFIQDEIEFMGQISELN
ncbi:hypothetical protein DM02DRAFT_22313 [Periconia macrospinosa]|uniref:F-box domain-containing protein n=1 Tax=Periconia macrospinosa TaxID=97972 RepID=A0A2V1CXH1_9PLEO|nr:hypothetical protein DM02DRAFT_22313 [Periconia macrospinosa]